MKKLIVTATLLIAAAASSYAGSDGLTQYGYGTQSKSITVPTTGYCYMSAWSGAGGFAAASLGSFGSVYSWNGGGSNSYKSGSISAGTYNAYVNGSTIYQSCGAAISVSW